MQVVCLAQSLANMQIFKYIYTVSSILLLDSLLVYVESHKIWNQKVSLPFICTMDLYYSSKVPELEYFASILFICVCM